MVKPQIRTKLISEAMGDGLGIFDATMQKSYILNATSSLVFQHCDGETTTEQMTALMQRKFNVPRGQAEQMVWLALGELEKFNLLQEKVTTTQAPRHMITRRQAFAAFAAAGLSLALLPVVSPLSMTNSPAMAAPLWQTGTGAVTTAPPTTPPPTTPPPTTPPPTTPPPTTTTTTTTTPAPVFPFAGFFPPVDNPPVYNEVKAGRSIPFKFSLSGYQGMDIIESGYPVSYSIPCDGSAPVSPIEETVISVSGLSYDPISGQYVYVWKTEKSWSGSCRQFKLRLSDGTDHYANFTFK